MLSGFFVLEYKAIETNGLLAHFINNIKKPEITENQMTEGELKKYLQDLVLFMRQSAESYDEELTGEAPRLAVCIKILVNETKQTRSLLGQLGLKKMFFYDIAPDYNPELALPFSALAIVTIGKAKHRYLPRLEAFGRIEPKRVSFDAWWNKPVIVDPERKLTLTRREIVLAVSNTHAGMANKKLDEAYNNLLRRRSPVWDAEMTVVDAEMLYVEFASVRHMAFEILRSLEDQLPKDFK